MIMLPDIHIPYFGKANLHLPDGRSFIVWVNTWNIEVPENTKLTKQITLYFSEISDQDEDQSFDPEELKK